jgi:protein-tyrosine-phosphatase
MGAAQSAVAAARERECDLTAHQAHLVREEDMAWADAVYGLTMAHVRTLRTVFPPHAEKTHLLPGGDVPDPLGGTLDDYRKCAERLEKDFTEL